MPPWLWQCVRSVRPALDSGCQNSRPKSPGHDPHPVQPHYLRQNINNSECCFHIVLWLYLQINTESWVVHLNVLWRGIVIIHLWCDHLLTQNTDHVMVILRRVVKYQVSKRASTKQTLTIRRIYHTLNWSHVLPKNTHTHTNQINTFLRGIFKSFL